MNNFSEKINEELSNEKGIFNNDNDNKDEEFAFYLLDAVKEAVVISSFILFYMGTILYYGFTLSLGDFLYLLLELVGLPLSIAVIFYSFKFIADNLEN